MSPLRLWLCQDTVFYNDNDNIMPAVTIMFNPQTMQPKQIKKCVNKAKLKPNHAHENMTGKHASCSIPVITYCHKMAPKLQVKNYPRDASAFILKSPHHITHKKVLDRYNPPKVRPHTQWEG